MCGLAVSVGHLDAAVEAAVDRMSAAQVHRGPDAGAVWRSPPDSDGRGVVLAHRRLSIIDLSVDANQPMHDEQNGNVLVFNGEIYGFQELRSELRALGVAFRTRSDSEVLLKAYAVWGEDCVRRLRGMFAFALWDARRRVLLIARDRVGIKPLYWARIFDAGGRATILIASELRALLASGRVDRKMSTSALATYAWNGFVNGDQTAVAGVHSLPAGHFASLGLDGEVPASQPYWRIPATPGVGGADLAELRAELSDAMRQHLISDVPVGVFLSGGIDSSAITALASAADRGRICTFTISFEDPRFDESAHARRVAQALGTEHHEILLTESTFRAQAHAALDGLDQPSFDAINTYCVSRAVREAGITVALAGTGGDELFGGYKSFREIPRGCRIARTAGILPASLLRGLAGAVTRLATGSPGGVPPQTRWGKLEDALATRGEIVDLYQVSYALYTGRFLAELLDRDVLDGSVRGLSPQRHAELAELVDGRAGLREVSALEVSNFLGQRLLRDTDAASMAVSLEVRVPLLDHRVIESVWRLSEDRRFQPLGRKQALRDVALGALDPAIFERPKSGFVLPIDRWAREGLRAEITDTLHDRERCRSIGLVPEAVARLWQAFESGAPGLYWSRVWAVFVLLRWCGKHAVALERG